MTMVTRCGGRVSSSLRALAMMPSRPTVRWDECGLPRFLRCLVCLPSFLLATAALRSHFRFRGVCISHRKEELNETCYEQALESPYPDRCDSGRCVVCSRSGLGCDRHEEPSLWRSGTPEHF